MSQQPHQNNPYPTEPHGVSAPAPGNLSDSVEDAAGGLKAQWARFGLPIQVGLVVGALILLAAFARYVLPAMLAAIGVGAVIAVLFIPYWLPTIVAFMRKHPNKAAIALVNFFFGWTFIGWFICLIWAVTDPAGGGGNQSVVVNVSNNATAGMPMAAAPHPYAPQPAVGQGPQYRVGDVVNGHRFDGVNWVPESAPQPPPPPAQP